MVGVPMLKAERISRSGPKLSDAQTRNFEAIKYNDCTARLCRRREALAAAGKSSCKANAAVARELACWVWEIGRRAEGTLS